VGMGSESDCLFGQLERILWISDSEAGVNVEKTGIQSATAEVRQEKKDRKKERKKERKKKKPQGKKQWPARLHRAAIKSIQQSGIDSILAVYNITLNNSQVTSNVHVHW